MADDQVNQQDVVQEEEQVDEFKSKYLRALADYQNLERQTASWKDQFVQYANLSLITKLLEVLDDLEKAQEHLKDPGLELVATKLKTTLLNEGLVELELLDQDYNPAEAEVISTEPGDKPNVITKVLQKGYRMKDKVVRPAKVVVSQVT